METIVFYKGQGLVDGRLASSGMQNDKKVRMSMTNKFNYLALFQQPEENIWILKQGAKISDMRYVN